MLNGFRLYGISGNHTYLYGKPPNAFRFDGSRAIVSARDNDVQAIINYFKTWLPAASAQLKRNIELEQARVEHEERQRLKLERDAEERRLKLLQTIKI